MSSGSRDPDGQATSLGHLAELSQAAQVSAGSGKAEEHAGLACHGSGADVQGKAGM